MDYCSGLSSTFIFIGHIVRIAKIFIPIIIIGMGMMDLFKAIVGSKEDTLGKAVKSLVFRAIAGVCIFFLPALWCAFQPLCLSPALFKFYALSFPASLFRSSAPPV